jgi:glycosyltransferase involved in cell wall biosynthesis
MINTLNIQLSIALLTRNRPQSLDLCLESLRSQSCQPFEVIVSDDSDAQHQLQVQQIAEKWRCQYASGPRKGLYSNRNYAALKCSGTHIRTMDDDHRLPVDHLATCVDAVASDPTAIWTVGERGYVDGQYHATLETANQLHPSGLGQSVQDLDDNWAIADGSTIYPAQVFEQGHKMVEWYGYGPSYLEFGPYLYRHGFKSRCVRGALVEHYADKTTLNRMNDSRAIESRLFASLCFNLYFRTNRILALKYTIACLRDASFAPQLIQALPLTFERARKRWLSGAHS